MNESRKKKLVGPVIAIRTFRTDDGKLNLEKQQRHLRWMIDQGIDEGNGVVIGAGGGGEGYYMDDGEWRAIVELTAGECQGRVPSIAGIFELSAREAVRKAVIAAELGIDFVQIQPPHYMVPTDDEVFEHYKAVNEAADVGIMLYNAPWAMPQPGYEEYDALTLRMYVDPILRVHMPEELKWRGMGEGPLARLGMEAAGLSMGPSFPSQQPLSDEFIHNFRESYDKSGVAEWVDWKE